MVSGHRKTAPQPVQARDERHQPKHCSARRCDGTVCALCRELSPRRRRLVITSKA